MLFPPGQAGCRKAILPVPLPSAQLGGEVGSISWTIWGKSLILSGFPTLEMEPMLPCLSRHEGLMESKGCSERSGDVESGHLWCHRKSTGPEVRTPAFPCFLSGPLPHQYEGLDWQWLNLIRQISSCSETCQVCSLSRVEGVTMKALREA